MDSHSFLPDIVSSYISFVPLCTTIYTPIIVTVMKLRSLLPIEEKPSLLLQKHAFVARIRQINAKELKIH